MPGHLVISLDFELHWGIRDHTDTSEAKERLLGVWKAIPAMLSLFAARKIRATWATVGMLMATDRDELLSLLPRIKPNYRDPALDPYRTLGEIGRSESDDPLHYAPSLVQQIAQTDGQEVGTHTFSHYYTLEQGQDLDAFVADMRAAREIAQRRGIVPRSIVFPRNQYGPDHIELLPGLGITAFRGASRGRLYQPKASRDESRARRALRLLDSYLPLSGSDVRRARPWQSTLGLPAHPAVDIPSSRFLRPYSPALRRADPIRLARITRGMTAAAETGGDYHLWWHPHNFGTHLEDNLSLLSRILDRFEALRDSHGMQSAHMADRAAASLG